MIQRIHEVPVRSDGRAAPGQRASATAHAPAPALVAPPPRAAVALLVGATALVAALGALSGILKHALGVAHGPLDLVPLLDLGAEAGLGAWYTSVLLLLAAALLALVGWVASARGQRFARHWLVLGAIFLLLSADETIQFHERVAWPIERVLRLKGAFLYGWVIPALAFLLVLGLSYFKFLAHLSPRTRRRFVLAGVIYVGGAVGLEMVEGVYATRHGNATGAYALLVAVEEVMEMSGVALFVAALLAHARDACGGVTFRLAPATAHRSADFPAPPLASIGLHVTAVPSGFPPPGPAAPPPAAPRGRVVA
jgi:hypothetical protein